MTQSKASEYPAYVDDSKIVLGDNARTVIEKRYVRRDEDGLPVETIAQMFYRVAVAVAQGDPNKTRTYYELISKTDFLPNTPTFTGAGTPLAQLAACFPAGTMVTTIDGPRPIESVAIGDYVLTHAGHYRPVYETMDREDWLYRVKIDKLPDMYVTGEHPFLTNKGWVKTSDLVPKQSFVKIGFNQEVAEEEHVIHFEGEVIDGYAYQRNTDAKNRSGPISSHVVPVKTGTAVDEDLAWLFGMYISQGSINSYDIRFTVGVHNQAQAERIIRILDLYFGLQGRILRTDNEERGSAWLNARIHSKFLAEWLMSNFGKGSGEKYIPHWMMTAQHAVQRAFLQGVADGDGTPINMGQTRIVLSNEGLVRQLFEIARRLGYYPNLKPVHMGKLCRTQPWSVSYGTRYKVGMVKEDCYRVTEVELTGRAEKVYNFEVEEDHTYVANQVVVHNCFVLKIKDDMASIFQTLKEAALIQQTGGGVGFSFGNIRQKDAHVSRSSGKATGPVGFLQVYDRAFGEIAQGGCLIPSTLVNTSEGLLRLDEIADVHTRGWKDHSISVPTDEGQQHSHRSFNNGQAPVYRVRTEDGVEIVGTLNHKVKVETDDGTIKWKKLEDLDQGDELLILPGQHQGKIQTLKQPEYVPEGVQMPTTLNKKLAFLVGYGFVEDPDDDFQFSFIAPLHTPVSRMMKEILSTTFPGCPIDIVEVGGTVNFIIESPVLRQFLEINGLMQAQVLINEVPLAIRKSPKTVVAAYLRGILQSKASPLHYPTFRVDSEQMANKIQTLLIGLGCPAAMRRFQTGGRGYHHVSILSSEGLTVWHDNVTYEIEKFMEQDEWHEGESGRAKYWYSQVASVVAEGTILTLDMEVENNHTYIANGVVTHNSRRGANMAVLPCHHPDIRAFITCKAIEKSIPNFNISVGVTQNFMEQVELDGKYDIIEPHTGKVLRQENAREIFDLIVHYAHKNGEPGILFLDEANDKSTIPHLGKLTTTNPCFAPDALIQTKQGHFRIKDLVGETVDIWDGKQWVEIDNFRVTGRNQRMVRIVLKGGQEINVTEYHKMFLEDGTDLLAKDVVAGQNLMWSNAPVTHGDIQVNGAYLKGFLLGDGTSANERPELWLYSDKKKCADRLIESLRAVEKKTIRANAVAEPMVKEASYSGGRNILVLRGMTPAKEELNPWASHYKMKLPSEVFQWDLDSKAELIAGMFDSDGTCCDNAGGFKYQLSSIYRDFLMDVKELLMTMGVSCSLSIMKRAQPVDFNDGYGEYQALDSWRLNIPQLPSIILAKLVKFSRLKDFSGKQMKTDAGSKRNVVVSVSDGGIEEEVYCCTVPFSHKIAISNGIITGNCGEQYMLPYENCCLGSVNLAKHTKLDENGDPTVDWEKLRYTATLSTFFLDDVIDANQYVPAVPQLREAAMRVRRIGLGIMGLADMLIELKIPYDSQSGRMLAQDVMEYIHYVSMSTSVDIARDKGAFKAFEGSLFDTDINKAVPYPTRGGKMNRPLANWDKVRRDIQEYGIRNCTNTTVAPTGTLSTAASLEGYGCEPVFALGYIRHFKDGDKDVELYYASPLLEAELGRSVNDGIMSATVAGNIRKYAAENGTLHGCHDAPDWMIEVFKTSGDISPENHIAMQAALQKFCSNSISKTINFPREATKADVAKAYMLAFESGCRGITVYVTGSREDVVLETKATKNEKAAPVPKLSDFLKEAEAAIVEYANRPFDPTGLSDPLILSKAEADKLIKATTTTTELRKRVRPVRMSGETYRQSTPLGDGYITINEDQDGPLEVFINIGKAGSETTAISEAFGRLISMILRMPSPVTPMDRLEQVAQEMNGIGGSRPHGFGINRVASLADGIARSLISHIVQKTDKVVRPSPTDFDPVELPVASPASKRKVGDICPECGEASFINTEGCRKCTICGYSEC